MSKLFRILLPMFVLLASMGVVVILIKTRPQAAQVESRIVAVQVSVLRAEPHVNTIVIEAMGKVVPVYQLMVQAEVGGKVISRNPKLIPGGLLQEGEELLRIDDRDYKSALQTYKAAVESSKVALADEQGRKRVAEQEWQGFTDQLDEPSRDFALRQPHVQSAKATLKSSQEQLAKARRDIDRTQIIAPFAGVVVDTSVEVGQIVSPQTPLATLAGTERYWVEVSLPVSKLSALEIPGINSHKPQGSSARIIHDVGLGRDVEYQAYVERLESAVDERGRLARLLLVVEDPFDLKQEEGNRRLPLLINSYVRVELAGKVDVETVEVPRTAVKDDQFVWLVVDDKLMRREVSIVWRTPKSVFVQGLRAGEKIVTTPLATPTEGMQVVVEE